MRAELTVLPPSAGPLAAAHAFSDEQLLEIWLHGRSPHTQRAYRADIDRFRAGAGKGLRAAATARSRPSNPCWLSVTA